MKKARERRKGEPAFDTHMETIGVVLCNELRRDLSTDHLGVVTQRTEEGKVVAQASDPV